MQKDPVSDVERSDVIDQAQVDLTNLFGDTASQDDVERFLTAFSASESNREVQGSLVSIALSTANHC